MGKILLDRAQRSVPTRRGPFSGCNQVPGVLILDDFLEARQERFDPKRPNSGPFWVVLGGFWGVSRGVGVFAVCESSRNALESPQNDSFRPDSGDASERRS